MKLVLDDSMTTGPTLGGPINRRDVILYYTLHTEKYTPHTAQCTEGSANITLNTKSHNVNSVLHITQHN